MSRLQLALNVADLDEAVSFYSRLFAVNPAKVRPGYANFAIDEPPLKLVLIEDPMREPGSLNHLGVEVESTDEVVAARDRFANAGLTTSTVDEVSCCHATQDKVWVEGPGGGPWEFYTVLADTERPPAELRSVQLSGDPCCTSRADLAAPRPASTCC